MALPGNLEQVIEALDITDAIDKLDDNTTTLTAEDVVKIFSKLREKAKASSARVVALPSTHLSIADLKEIKHSLQARLGHLHSAGGVL